MEGNMMILDYEIFNIRFKTALNTSKIAFKVPMEIWVD
jgi:hypothetical protein